MPAVADLAPSDRGALAAWIGERPETILAVAALQAGVGRIWISGSPTEPDAALIESPLVPGEPHGFGRPDAIVDLLAGVDDWRCIELDPSTAQRLEGEFDRLWGLQRVVIDVVHRLDRAVEIRHHQLVRALTLDDLSQPAQTKDVLPDDEAAVAASAAAGTLFGAVDSDVIVGQAGSMATGSEFADVGVHVAEPYRRQGIATAAASQTCAILRQREVTPVWSTGAHNAASLAVAKTLGFTEIATLTYLVRDRT